MKVKKIIYNPDKKGVFRISVVERPAVDADGKDIVLFSEQKIEDLKGVFYAPVMVPDFKIPRIDEATGEQYKCYYDADTIEQLANNYFKQGGNVGTNIEHEEDNTDGVYPIESWIVKDPENDKSVALGMPKQVAGTWIMGYKCDSPEVLEKVKNKLLNGLSIEGQVDMTDDKTDPIYKFNFQIMKKTPLEFAKHLANVIMSAVVDEEKDKTEDAPEAKTEDAPTDEPKKEEEEVKMEDAPKEEDAPTEPTDLEKENETLKATVEELTKKVSDLEAELATYKNDAVLMSEQLKKAEDAFENYKSVKMSSVKLGDLPPAAIPVKKYEDMTNIEKVRYNKANKY